MTKSFPSINLYQLIFSSKSKTGDLSTVSNLDEFQTGTSSVKRIDGSMYNSIVLFLAFHNETWVQNYWNVVADEFQSILKVKKLFKLLLK